MNQSLPSLEIKAHTNKHARFLVALGLFLILINCAISMVWWNELRLVLMFVYLVALVVVITGVAKLSEPKFSLTITPQNITYHHRYGQWQLNWSQIKRLGLVKETYGVSQIELPYLGVKLNDISELVTQISPRLANRLIHEQKPLIAFAIKCQLMPFEQGVISFEPVHLGNGQLLKGPVAAFIHHCRALDRALGFHLFIPHSSMDRELTDFHQLLNKCQAYAKNYH
ncbi:DUF2982 domain-containing protein [Litorilituus lipolyticus]|uniref:DUF2982 domain-containing protein n=1 Tax=Litorilituus lipolyticus TaxID=2491017 RepID=A0A502KT48_9GAMM|nr:DUF2982 domain-containing protein [Litorilituus lipolyticus]TPH13589.1 DUF2982 domain-containing protein [Litorilituus lipolyticus]